MKVRKTKKHVYLCLTHKEWNLFERILRKYHSFLKDFNKATDLGILALNSSRKLLTDIASRHKEADEHLKTKIERGDNRPTFHWFR